MTKSLRGQYRRLGRRDDWRDGFLGVY